MGTAFGNSSASSLFGSSGSANFLSRTTAILASVFFSATLALTFLSSKNPELSAGVFGSQKQQAVNLYDANPNVEMNSTQKKSLHETVEN